MKKYIRYNNNKKKNDQYLFKFKFASKWNNISFQEGRYLLVIFLSILLLWFNYFEPFTKNNFDPYN